MSQTKKLLYSFDGSDYETCLKNIALLNSERINLTAIAVAVKRSSLPENEKKRLYEAILNLCTLYPSLESGLTPQPKEIIQFILTASATGLLERELNFAIEETKECIAAFPESRTNLSITWRNALSYCSDYNLKIKLFTAVDKKADLDELITRELFVTHSYSADPSALKELILTEIELSHIFIIERIIACLGGVHEVIALSGITAEEFAEKIESNTYKRSNAEVTAVLLSREIRGERENYEKFVLEDAERGNRVTAVNLVSYAAYNYFLRYGNFSPTIETAINSLEEKNKGRIMPFVIKLYIRCVEKCIDEDMDICDFISATSKISMFTVGSDFKPLEGDAMWSINEDGLKSEISFANNRRDLLLSRYTDRSLLCYIIMNTHFGVLCDIKYFIEALFKEGANINELFSRYPIRGYVIGINNSRRRISVKAHRYNIDNVLINPGNFHGIIHKFHHVSYIITGAVESVGNIRDNIIIQAQLIENEPPDTETVTECIENAVAAADKNADAVTAALQQFPHGKQYSYSRIRQNIFRGIKKAHIINSCKKLLYVLKEKYDSRTVLKIYMNSFMRVYCPLEEVLKILHDEVMDALLYEYSFSGIRKHTESGDMFSTYDIMMQGYVKMEQPENFRNLCRFSVSESGGFITLTAIPVVSDNIKASAAEIKKQVKIKLLSCCKYKHLQLTDPETVTQAEGLYLEQEDYENLINGFFIRAMDYETDFSDVIGYLKYYEPINPFTYDIFAADKVKTAFIKNRWYSVRRNVNCANNCEAVKSRLMNSFIPFDDVCYIFMSSPLRFEFSIVDFLMECLENFITDTTVSHNLKLLCVNPDRENPYIPYLRAGIIPEFPPETKDYDYFTFEIDLSPDGTLKAVNAEPCNTEKNIDEDIPLPVLRTDSSIRSAKDFFENESYRSSIPFESAVTQISGFDTCIADYMCGDYRIFGKVMNRGGKTFLSPLNVKIKNKNSLPVFCCKRNISYDRVYSMIPLKQNKNGTVMLVPYKEYPIDCCENWWDKICDKDVAVPPCEESYNEVHANYSTLRLTSLLIQTYPDATLPQLIGYIRNSTYQCLYSIHMLICYFYKNSSVSCEEINEAMKDYVIFARKCKNLCFMNSLIPDDHTDIYFYAKSGLKKVHFIRNKDAAAVMRFARCTISKTGEIRFHFIIERFIEYVPALPWHLYKDTADLPECVGRYTGEDTQVIRFEPGEYSL